MKLTKQQQVHIKKIAAEFHLDLIILFGSRAKNTAHAKSDFDVAIRSTKKLSFKRELTLWREFDRIFPNADLCNVGTATPLLLAAIVQDGVLLYERKHSLYAEFKIFAVNQYLDFKPELDRLAKRNREFLKTL